MVLKKRMGRSTAELSMVSTLTDTSAPTTVEQPEPFVPSNPVNNHAVSHTCVHKLRAQQTSSYQYADAVKAKSIFETQRSHMVHQSVDVADALTFPQEMELTTLAVQASANAILESLGRSPFRLAKPFTITPNHLNDHTMNH